jgi:hypothetical protein
MNNVKPHPGMLFIRKEKSYRENYQAFMVVFLDKDDCFITVDVNGNGCVKIDPCWIFEGFRSLTKWLIVSAEREDT